MKISLSDALIQLEVLSSRKKTGNSAIKHLETILSSLSADDAEVICRVIKKDLRCGCSDSIASRVWPGLVPVFDVMLCGKDMTKIKYPAYAQLKCDGSRVILFYVNGSVRAMSRTGKEFQLLGALDDSASKVMKEGECWDGELLVVRDGKVLDRATSNGILNKCSKGTITQEEANMIVAVCWDMPDFSGKISYKDRFDEMLKRPINDKITIVPSKIVNSEEEAMQFFAEQLQHGEEGAIIKNMGAMWKGSRSNDCVKLKAVETADLIVVDIFEGTGKYVGMLGGLTCETSDGLLQVNVGTGFSDELRKNFNRTYWISQIVEVLYNAKIKSKGKDKASLFLPRFNMMRFDKTIANTIDELV